MITELIAAHFNAERALLQVGSETNAIKNITHNTKNIENRMSMIVIY